MIGESIRRLPARQFIEYYESVIQTTLRLTTRSSAAKPAKTAVQKKVVRAGPSKRRKQPSKAG